jgi:phosphinothricin acetyltransferase
LGATIANTERPAAPARRRAAANKSSLWRPLKLTSPRDRRGKSPTPATANAPCKNNLRRIPEATHQARESFRNKHEIVAGYHVGMSAPTIRDAREDDLPAIDAIYDHYVGTSTCTFQYQPAGLEARRAWFAEHGPTHPVTVALAGGEVVAWASLSRYKQREGYRFTGEDSIYIRPDWCRRGLGALLLADLVARATELGYHSIVAGVSSDQPGSLALHKRFGFSEVARFREVGYKFDRWLDVIYLQLSLAHEASPR